MERLNANVDLAKIPRNGIECYHMVVASLSAEIEEKSEILTEMSNEDVKQKFISGWRPGIQNVNIHV